MKKYTFNLSCIVFPLLNFSQEKGLDKKIDEAFQPVSDFFNDVVFFHNWRQSICYISSCW